MTIIQFLNMDSQIKKIIQSFKDNKFFYKVLHVTDARQIILKFHTVTEKELELINDEKLNVVLITTDRENNCCTMILKY